MLNRLTGMRFIALAILLTIFPAACAGPQTVKPYAVVKATAEEILYDARVLQNKGTITAAQFEKVAAIYDKVAKAQSAVIEARKTVAQMNLDYDAALKTADQNALNNINAKLKAAQTALNANMGQVTATLSELAALAADLGIKAVK